MRYGGSVTKITCAKSYSTKTRFVYYPNRRYVPCYLHSPVTMMLSSNRLYSTFNHREQFFCFSCCHWNGTKKCKLLTNCFRAKQYAISNHILLLASEPHTVRLLVKSAILKLSGSPQNLFQQMTVCDSIRESLFHTFAFVTSVNCINENVYESHPVIATCDVIWFTLCHLRKNNFAIFFVENNSGCNLSPCWCIDTHSYG